MRALAFLLGIFILLSSLPYLFFSQKQVSASNSYSVHNLTTGLNYETIQEAIDAPETLAEHVILVGAGTYYEEVTMDKSIILEGENRETTLVDGNGTANPYRERDLVSVTADNATIMGFTIRNSAYQRSGIKITNAKNCNVRSIR
jgi:pectin methylesterase-like acyl-CoA thioesterase